MKGRGPLLATALLLLTAVSITPKLVRYTTILGVNREDMELSIVRTLQTQGYERHDTLDLVTGGVVRMLRFSLASCPQPLGVAVLGGSAESDELLSLVVDPAVYDISFVYMSQTSTKPPLFRYLLTETVTAIGRAIGLSVPRQQPILGVTTPRVCAARPTWPNLLNREL